MIYDKIPLKWVTICKLADFIGFPNLAFSNNALFDAKVIFSFLK